LETSLYIATHKNYWFPDFEKYKPLYVGAAYSQDRFTELCDDNGISISYKNKNYCELTGLYWIWKNDITSDIVGLCHYRRYFDFNDERKLFVRQFNTDKNFRDYANNFVDPQNVEKFLVNADIILPVPYEFDCTIQEHYYKYHIANDFDIMKASLIKLYPEYKASMEYIFNQRWIYLCNMFIMRKKIFDSYMEWLFNILFAVEDKITISDDIYQARVFGFLAERLLNVYVYHNHLKTKEIPLIFLDEESSKKRYKHKKLKYFIRGLY
jgi:hypothetical protein